MAALNLNPFLNPLFSFQAQSHRFHILNSSAFPFLTGFFSFALLLSQTFFMHGLPDVLLFQCDLLHLSVLGLLGTVLFWFSFIIKESSQGFHTVKVQHGLRLGMLLFIASEVMFFFAFFWAFFHFSLVPSIAVGAVWPPVGTQDLNVWGLPLVNTFLLLASGVSITASHAYIVKSGHYSFSWYLLVTALLGLIFLYCQSYEYRYGVKFSWRDNIYGSIFFITTGFHGFHVTVGTLFLAFCWLREDLTTVSQFFELQRRSLLSFLTALLGYSLNKIEVWSFTPSHHFGFEAAAWYWHFVDVVWLFLFATIYWWGGR